MTFASQGRPGSGSPVGRARNQEVPGLEAPELSFPPIGLLILFLI